MNNQAYNTIISIIQSVCEYIKFINDNHDISLYYTAINNEFIQSLQVCQYINGIISNFDNKYIECNKQAPYLIILTPLEYTNNINASTIWSIYKLNISQSYKNQSFQSINFSQHIVSSGYCLYSRLVILISALKYKVLKYDYIKSWSHPYMITMGNRQMFYSINHNLLHNNVIPKEITKFVTILSKGYDLKHVGCLTTDIHRLLTDGGILLHPATQEYPFGQLNYLYQVLPMSYIINNSGGKVSDNINNKYIQYITDTCPVILGNIYVDNYHICK